MRCVKHAIRTTPSPDWWKRVLLVAPCYRNLAPGPTPGAVFTSEMISEAAIDRIVELIKLTNAGNSPFLILAILLILFYVKYIRRLGQLADCLLLGNVWHALLHHIKILQYT